MRASTTDAAAADLPHQAGTALSANDLRRRMRLELPPGIFAPRPLRALWFIPLLGIVGAAMAFVILTQPAWYWSLALALVIGQCLAAMGFLAHEALHGSMVSSTRLQMLLGYLGFAVFFVSPTLWKVWHNQVHHGNTNMGNTDPDSFGTVKSYKRLPQAKWLARLAPGSRHWSSAFFFAYWFAFHAQIVLWVRSKHMYFSGLDRRRAKIEMFVCVAFWTSLAFAAGSSSVYVVLIPLIIANAIVMSYIATNHFMRPQAEKNDPLANSMSVTTLPLIDRLHFRFSHHVEHHFFPRMSGASAPAVRAWLRANMPEKYVSPSHLTALVALYRTPRLYLDATTLCDVDDPNRTVDTDQIASAFAEQRPPKKHAASKTIDSPNVQLSDEVPL